MATKYGTAKGETITGTSGADTVYARAGNDTLLGRAGGDRLLGEDGNDKVHGEDGNDTLTGGFGDDLLDGGAGRDRALYTGISAPDGSGYGIWASLADGYANTSTVGQDTLRGIEDIDGSRFSDVIFGSSSDNLIGGGPGNDVLDGGAGADKLYGGLGNDAMEGEGRYDTTGGADQLYGGEGADGMFGRFGNDTLRGEAGEDYLSGDLGNDTLVGGGGSDTFGFHYYHRDESGGRDIVTDFVKGQDGLSFQIQYYDGDFSLTGFSELDTSGDGVLDDTDRYVEVGTVSYGDAAKTSTTIDLTEALGGDQYVAVVHGVTSLTESDFVT